MTFSSSLTHRSMADPLTIQMDQLETQMEQAGLEGLFNIFLRARIPTPQAYANARFLAEDVVYALRRAFYPMRMAEGVSGDSLIVGSVGKRTALSPIEMVDVLYLLPSKLKLDRSVDAHNAVSAGIHDQIEHSGVSIDEIGVVISGSSCRVRVIPAVETAEGYKIPGPNALGADSGWQISNPISEAATLRLSDSLNAGTTRLLLTLLKSWKEAAKVEVSSLALEILVQDYFATQKRQGKLSADFKAFLAWGRSRTPGTITASGAKYDIHLSNAWHESAKAAYSRATLAEQAELNDDFSAAMEWRHLLGMAFPVLKNSEESLPPILKACA